jgi:hypothetical protein
MSENQPQQQPARDEPQSAWHDERTERQRRREERRAARQGRHAGSWAGGAILIALGIILILQNAGMLALNNWWALFILLPAVGAFASAWRSYQQAEGHLTVAARSSLIGGLVLTLVAAVFLFNLNWGSVGPVLLILGGIGLLLNTLLPN